MNVHVVKFTFVPLVKYAGSIFARSLLHAGSTCRNPTILVVVYRPGCVGACVSNSCPGGKVKV